MADQIKTYTIKAPPAGTNATMVGETAETFAAAKPHPFFQRYAAPVIQDAGPNERFDFLLNAARQN
jgi:hypothetical protein